MKKNKLIILVGKSGSGKSTIESKIDKLGFAKRLISNTTRKPRSNEKDGQDYYYISDLEFDEKLKRGEFAEHSTYTTVNGFCKYGMQMKDIDLSKSNYICVVNPHGMKQMLNKLGKSKCVTIYIDRDDRERVCSSLTRDKSKDFSKVLKETSRRFEADEIDFKNINHIVDYVVVNQNLDTVINRVVDIIEDSL